MSLLTCSRPRRKKPTARRSKELRDKRSFTEQAELLEPVSPKPQKLRKRLRNDYPYRQLFDIPEEVLDLTEPTSAKPHRSGSRKAGRPRREIFAEADQLQRDGTNWREIASRLDPQTFAHSPEAAIHAIQRGARRLRRRPARKP